MKKGFTLIELLAVITILALVALVTSISVANMLKDSKNELSDAQMKSIEISAKAWGADNISLLPSGNSCSFITLKDLKEDGLLDSNISDPKNKKEISNDLKIKITSRIGGNGKSILSYEVDPDNIDECTYIGSNIYVDVPKGLTPVIYDGENWKVPESNEEWYNYDEQKWANAVVLVSGKTKKPGETVKVEGENPDALMMFVYIPRYEYKIQGQYGKGGTDADHPGEIEINFITKEKTTPSTSEYHVHPAFTFGGKELSGIWVGKFELSSVSSNATDNNSLGCNETTCTSNILDLRILPNIRSLRYNSISNFFYAIIRISNSFGISSVDSHMIKNSEWGAVAYLSQSKYGKYGNSEYDANHKEIYQNRSGTYMTGSSNGMVVSDGLTHPQCTYNQEAGTAQAQVQNNCGPGASTTGNIYGIYDMNGGATEYVMGVYGYADGIYSGENTTSNSGFNGKINYGNALKEDGAKVPNIKYYDKYVEKEGVEFSASTACEGSVCYGHALSETSGWYGDYATMIITGYPWFQRGLSGDGSSITSGIFSFNLSRGEYFNSNSTRVIITTE